MKYVKVDNSKISQITLGTANFGTSVSKELAFQLMDEFLAQGGNSIDTGRCYCYWIENGANASESTIGEYIKLRNNREKIFLSTKGGHPPIPHFEISRINKEELEKDINESLHYLNTDYLDVFYLHRDDENKPVSEIMEILNEFVKSGKTKFIGASNWRWQRIKEANEYAEKHGLEPFKFSQIMWSYADVNVDKWPDKTQIIMNDEEYEFYKNSNIQLTAYSSQAQGFFSVAAKKGIDNLDESRKEKYLNENNIKKLAETIEIGEKYNISPTAAGLGKMLNDPIKPITLIGCVNVDLLKDSLDSLKVEE